MFHSVLVGIALTCAVPGIAASAQDADPVAVVDAFAAAQQSFDPAALARLTAPDYVEISPLGEVDTRDKMLGFYAPKKVAVPAMTIDERTVRLTGNLALITQRYAFAGRAMRVGYVLRRDAGKWRLVSAQYTPIRAPQPA